MATTKTADTATNSRLRVALRRARRGRLVLPTLGGNSLVGGGLNAASCDPATIQQWWETWPDALPADCTGTGFVVIGGDGPEGKRAPHVDVEGDGGYVIAPSSKHASGTKYARENPETLVADLPPAVVARAVGDQLPTAPAPAPTDLADSLSTDEVLDALGPSNADEARAAPSAARPTPLIICAADLANRPDLLVAPTPVISGLAWAGRVTLFAGREKSGKSTLLSAGVAALSHGKPFLGEPTTLGRVLYWSADREALADQLARLRHFNAELANIDLVQRPPVNLEEVGLHLDGHAVLVVDTLASASPEVSNVFSATEWVPLLLRYVEMARTAGCAVVLVYHANRTTGKYRDSTALGATVDVIVEMAPGADPDCRELATVARFPAPAKRAVRLAGTDDRAWFEVVGLLRPQLDARLIVAVEGEPGHSATEYANRLGARKADVLASLKRLAHDGTLHNTGTQGRPAWHRLPGSAVPAVPSGSGNFGGGGAGSGSLPYRGEPHRPVAVPDGDYHGPPEPEPANPCPDCGKVSWTWLGGSWRCEECARAGAGVAP